MKLKDMPLDSELTIEVDSEMLSTSTNPVQNKVIKEYIDSKKIDVDDKIDSTSENPVQNKVIAKSFRNLIEDGCYVTITELTGPLSGSYSIKKIFSGSGTPENPYRMGSQEDFMNLVTYMKADPSFLSSCFVQDDDIDISQIQDWHGLQGNVSNSDNPFTGTWDGNGYEFKSVQAKAPNRSCSYYQGGLFNCLSNATIKNLTVDSVCDYTDLDSKMEGSIIAGQLLGNTTFENVTTRGTLIAKNNCGAFMSLKMHPKTPDETNNIVFKNCVNEANIKIIGIQSDSGNAAGFIGKVQSNTNIIFENCENKGHIGNENDIRERHLAGFVGDAQKHNISCINCTNTGEIDNFNGQYSQFVGQQSDNLTMIGDNYCLSSQRANANNVPFGSLDADRGLMKLLKPEEVVPSENVYYVMNDHIRTPSCSIHLNAGESVKFDVSFNPDFEATSDDTTITFTKVKDGNVVTYTGVSVNS